MHPSAASTKLLTVFGPVLQDTNAKDAVQPSPRDPFRRHSAFGMFRFTGRGRPMSFEAWSSHQGIPTLLSTQYTVAFVKVSSASVHVRGLHSPKQDSIASYQVHTYVQYLGSYPTRSRSVPCMLCPSHGRCKPANANKRRSTSRRRRSLNGPSGFAS